MNNITGYFPDGDGTDVNTKQVYIQKLRTLCTQLQNENIALQIERDELKKALEMMYADNKGYNPDGMGNPIYYIQQAKESIDYAK